MFNDYTVESFDDVNLLTDYVEIIIDGKSGGRDKQTSYEGILLNKSYHRNWEGKVSINTFDISIAAYDSFADVCYGPIKLTNLVAGPGYKSRVTIKILDKTNPDIKDKFDKVSMWIKNQ